MPRGAAFPAGRCAVADRTPMEALLDQLAASVAARLRDSLAAPAPDPDWGKVSQTTLPAWIHAKAYVEACRAGKIAGARLWRRQWIADRAAVERWWIEESRDPAANEVTDEKGGGEDPLSDEAVLRANGLALAAPASRKRGAR